MQHIQFRLFTAKSPGESCNEYCLLVLSDAKFAVHASLTSAVTPDIRRSWSRASACTNTQNNVSSCQNCGCFRPLVLITCHLYIFGVGQSCSKLRLDSEKKISKRQLSDNRGLASQLAGTRDIRNWKFIFVGAGYNWVLLFGTTAVGLSDGSIYW